MLILGIDPGLERIGYGLVRREGSKLTAIKYGLIQTPRIALHDRLRITHEAVTQLLVDYVPDCMATERLLFTVNKTTAMDVAKSLGAILLAASEAGVDWTEYSPPEVKQSVVGNGRADKTQVGFMVQRLLSLESIPKPDDVADALAIAITHALRAPLRAQLTARATAQTPHVGP